MARLTDDLEEIKKIDSLSQSSSLHNVKGDAIVQVLRHDKPGRLRALGRGCTLIKLTLSRSRDKQVSQYQNKIEELESMIHMLMDKKSIDDISELLNWDGTSEVVVEGRVVSTDPNKVVNDIRIGPNAVSVIIDCVNKPDAYLWRPTPSVSVLGEADNKLVACPASCVSIALRGHFDEERQYESKHWAKQQTQDL